MIGRNIFLVVLLVRTLIVSVRCLGSVDSSGNDAKGVGEKMALLRDQIAAVKAQIALLEKTTLLDSSSGDKPLCRGTDYAHNGSWVQRDVQHKGKRTFSWVGGH